MAQAKASAFGRGLERAALVVLLVAALVPRLFDVAAPLDRGFDGEQGGFFAIGAINFERLGLRRTGGYPVLNIDLGDRADPATRLWDRPELWVSYANHPPTVPLIAWASLNVFAPDDWNAAWREARGPRGFELALRLPFLVLHLAALVALWWAMREGYGPRAGLLALALAAGVPILVLDAGLPNYENGCLVFVLLGAGFHARWMRGGRKRDLAALAASYAAAGAVTWAPLGFAAALVAHALFSAQRKRGLVASAVALTSAAVPLVVHSLWAASVVRRLGQPSFSSIARARELLAPLLDGSVPAGRWLGVQVERMVEWCTLPLCVVAVAGLVVAAIGARRRAAAGRVPIALPLALGGLLYLAAFYRHTADPQTPFYMLVAPGACALAAAGLEAVAPRLERLRAGLAPLVVLVSSIAMFGIARTSELRHALRAPAGDTRAGHAAPELALPHEMGAALAEVLPPGSLGLHPRALGLNLAVSLYAWRSLWAINGPDDSSPDIVAKRVGLAAAPRWLALPDPPPERLSNELSALRNLLVRNRAPDTSAASWSAWRLSTVP
jgi:hypothetical protein